MRASEYVPEKELGKLGGVSIGILELGKASFRMSESTFYISTCHITFVLIVPCDKIQVCASFISKSCH